MWTPLQLPQAFVKIIVSQSFRPENEMKWIFGWAFSLNLLARRQETLVSSSQCLLCRILSQIFLIFFVFVFVFVFTLLGYSGISNDPALAKLPTCQHNESSPLQSSHGHWNMMIIYKRFLKSFFAFLDALASLRPGMTGQNRRIQGALPENPGYITGESTNFFLLWICQILIL